MNKTVIQARELIESMEANSQQFSSRGSEPHTKGVNQVDEIIELRQQMSNMMAIMQQIAAVVVKPSRPSYENVEHVNAIFSTQPYGIYSNTHEQVASTSSVYNHPSEFQQQVQQPQQGHNPELEKMATLVEALMSMVQQNQQLANLNQQKTDNVIRELQAQVEETPKEPVLEEKDDDFPQTCEVHKSKPKHLVYTYVPPLPFLGRFSKANKKVEQDRDVWDVFKKVQVNIPLIEVIRQSPRYAKCVKKLCTNKHTLTCNEEMSVGENTSAYLKKKLPPKLKDPGSFTIPCTIGKTRFTKTMLDLGASINVMPTSIYDALNLGPLKKTGIVTQLADRSNIYPKEIVEDVLVQAPQGAVVS
ncbi:uncharacterized protein LOC113359409 [Papaver somniferum]|uniref:uncharacterized protein LOC113359409 n=1 Tax=Papaver somniferum TaxID=3469 RepID=UPI000E7006C6|nr:uncharacterized protein LOC113359409 [Papaver somniferum]